MRLENKVALITGAASGMGASMARIFAGEGAKVVVADGLEEEGRAVVADITRSNGVAMFHPLDVRNEAQWKTAIDATLAAYSRLDILVNDAGVSGSGITADLFDTAAWDRLMAVNARGVFLGIKFAIPVMRAQGGGSIVNISSLSVIIGQRNVHVGYSASKGAVRTLTKAAAVQHAADNIRVNSVHPGPMPPMRSWDAERMIPRSSRACSSECRWAVRAASKRWRTQYCFSPRTRLPLSPAPNSVSTAASSPHSRTPAFQPGGSRG